MLGHRKSPVDYREIIARARSAPEQAATPSRETERRGTPVLHADENLARRERLARVGLGDMRIRALREWWKGIREDEAGDDITFRMVEDAAFELEFNESCLVGRTIAVDLESAIELLAKLDELFPKIDDEGEDK